MALKSFRFAHSGNVRLDQPLRGTGPLSEEQRKTVIDAPLIAWQRLIDGCLGHDVDFLLLTPRTALDSLSFRALSALSGGFKTLQEFGVPVYWLMTHQERMSVPARTSWPENVQILSPGDEYEAVDRNGETCAIISVSGDQSAFSERVSDSNRPESDSQQRDRQTPVQILVSAEPSDRHSNEELSGPNLPDADYVARWGGRQADGHHSGRTLWHDPGPLQGRSINEPGAAGYCLVEFDERRNGSVFHRPVAPVRWERRHVQIDGDTSGPDLVEALQLALLDYEPAVGEQLCIVQWDVSGYGRTFAAIQNEATRDEISHEVDHALGNGTHARRLQRWNIRAAADIGEDDTSFGLYEWLDQQSESDWRIVCADVAGRLHGEGDREAQQILAEITVVDARERATDVLRQWMSQAAMQSEAHGR